ncbi:MAG TPA: HAD-IA family hydrolase [Abditibacteriaceae bacterium]|jgi:HAD superfamily hydrolase (TIGR01549 family)
MPLDALIFDIDGTLADTNLLHARAWQHALRSAGFPIPLDRIQPEIGKGSDQLLPAVLGAETAKGYKHLSDDYGEEFKRLLESEGAKAIDGAQELVEEARARGLRVAIATSAEREFLQKIADAVGFDLEKLFDEIVTASDAEKSKPEPDIVLAACEKLKLFPSQCALLGDTPHDAEAARHAGVVFLGVESGGHEESELRSFGARGVWKDAAALREDLDEALQLASPARVQLSKAKCEELMRAALDAAREGMKNGEVPIGCVIADGNGEIVARGWNEMNATQGKIAHAEIQTFGKANGKLPIEARDAILVSTLEPCVMCTGAAMEAAIDTIIHALRAPADSGTGRVAAPQSPESQMPRIVGDVLAEESRALFEEWLHENGGTPQASFVEQLLALT